MAGVMAQRMRKIGQLAAAYFCRHNDGTRNDPRYLLATVAHQLFDCNTQYREKIGGEDGLKILLGNSKLGIQELFTKLLQEPLSKCFPCDQRKLVIIDALDETEYESREDFLDLIMHRFPLLPEWLAFFITSRPEDSVQFRLKKYNPCVKICAGNSDQDNFYQQHEQDIQTFLQNKIDFSRLSVTVKDISKKCNGLFLYAHYIVEELRLSANSGKELNQLSDLFPGDIDDFFLQNFKRVHDQVGQEIFKKLFGCAIVAPSPLPVSIISYILKTETSNHDEQQVIDAVSQFVVLRTSDKTLTFLHNLIPAWLTDKNKARKFFIDKKISGEYLRMIFVEILSSIVNKSQPTCLSTDPDLEDYVSCVAVRFLCRNGAKDSLKAVFDCLTTYDFIKRRIQSGRIEIYRLLEDLRLVTDRLPVEEVSKQKILQEMVFALENNVLVLLECPHLLHSCLRNASNDFREAVFLPRMSTPWLQWTVVAFPDVNIADMQCFSTSPDGRTVVGAKRSSLLFFDVSTLKKVSGPFDLGKYANDINHLEFSPDGKFIFFGRLDKWFSVEQSCVQDFTQFSWNSQIYKWGVFADKGQCIVVKRPYCCNLTASICRAQNCLFKLLALWAVKEIEHSRDDEMTVGFELESGVLNESFSKRLKVKNKRYVVQTSEVLDDSSPTCVYCSRLRELTQSNQEPSLATVRELVIELYPFILDYQVWDIQTGMPVLQHVFSQGILLNPFTYLCHVTCAFGNLEVGCSGIEEAMSVCNIAMVNAFFGYENFCFKYELQLDLKSSSNRILVSGGVTLEEECCLLRQPNVLGDLMQELRQERKLVLKLQLEQKKEFLELVTEGQDRRWHLWTSRELMQRFKLKMDRKGSWNRLMSAVFEEFHNEAFKFGICTKTQKGFQSLVYDLNEEISICVPPKRKWIEPDGVLEMCLLQRGNQDQHFVHHRNPEHIISKFTHFTLTNDGLYCVYSCDYSLQALSLQTGTVFMSVSGFNLIYFTREKQVGYSFRSGTDERTIFLTNLSSPFKFFPRANASAVGKSIGAMFRSSNTLLSISSDSIISSWYTASNKESIALSRRSLSLSVQSVPVKNCLLSSDGRLIAIHQKTKVKLYSFADSMRHRMFLCTVYESQCEFIVACFAFSADGALLLFCIQDSGPCPHFHVWDVRHKVMAATLTSSELLTVECCCFSSDNIHAILCGDNQIEFWKYAEDTSRRLEVKMPYHFVKFSQCIVSLDNQLLVCCIANVIFIYNLHASDINSSKQVLRGHLGRIEFCRFLKVNRYLLSYGVNGMVFLWEISELKAVAFERITQLNEKIVAMAVSPEEDVAVCFISSDRVCMMKLCGLGAAPSSSLKPLTSSSKGKLETTETSLTVPRQIASTSTEDDMAESSSSSDSEEDMNEYYQEHDDDVYLM